MKKIISILLAALMLSQCVAVVSAQSGTGDAAFYNDTAVRILRAFDILPAEVDQNDFNPDQTVTRGELVYYVMKLTRRAADSGTQEFRDVPAGHPYGEYINSAVKTGLLSGYEDGTFHPDEPVLYEDCISVLINALGYGHYAKTSGGYPNGYILQAETIGLLDNMGKAVQGEVVKQGTLVQLLYNALSVDLAVIKWNGGQETYAVEKGRNLLTETWGVDKLEGIVTANSVTGLNGGKETAEGFAAIDGRQFEVGETDGGALLGYAVEAYYTTEKFSDTNTLVYITKKKNKNREVSINTKDITFYQDHRYEYTNSNDRNASVKFSAASDIIFNGKAVGTDYDKVTYVPPVGSVKLVDNNNDGQYEVVFITSYTTAVVHSVDVENEIIYSKEDPARNLNLKDAEDYKIIGSAGGEIGLEGLKENDVLSVAKTLDDTRYEIRCASNSMEVQITSVKSGERTFISGNVEYQVSGDFAGDFSKFVVGAQGMVYFDIFGDAAYFDYQSTGSLQYGYLKKCYYDNSTGEETLTLKILNTTDGEFRDYQVADKVVVDKASVKNNLYAVAELFREENGLKLQPVKFSLNAEGKISRLLTVKGGSIRLLRSNTTDGEKYWSQSATFDAKVPIADNTLVVGVPKPNQEDSEEINYSVKKKGALANGVRYYYEAYNSDEKSDLADLVVTYHSVTSAPVEQPIALVKEIGQAVNEEGDIVQKATLLYMGAEVEKFGVQEDTFDNAVAENQLGSIATAPRHRLEPGDAIRFSSDATGAVITPVLIYQKSTGTFFGNYTGAMDLQHRTICGSVYDKTSNHIKVLRDKMVLDGSVDFETASYEFYAYQKFNIYVYDESQKDPVYVGTPDVITDYLHGLSEYSKVLVQTKIGNGDTMIVYQ